MRFLDALYGLPYLPFAIITLAIFGTVNFWTMVVALTIASWFTAARVMRGQIISLKENDYVRAAYALGARRSRILFRHLLVNTLGVIIVFVFLELPGVILGEAFLSFIGLGISPPKASWGTLAQEGYIEYQAHPYIIVIPSLMIAWLILSAFFIADGLRDALDPRHEGDLGWRCSRSTTCARYFKTREGEVHAVDGVSFIVEEGKVLGIVGESGCGKSVTVLSIMGLVLNPGRVVSGSVRFDGRELAGLDERSSRTSAVTGSG